MCQFINVLIDSEFVGKKDSFTYKGNKSFNSTSFNLFSAFGLYFIFSKKATNLYFQDFYKFYSIQSDQIHQHKKQY